MTTIAPLPTPPGPGDSVSTFNARAFAFWASMPAMTVQINAVADETNSAKAAAEAAAAFAAAKAADAEAARVASLANAQSSATYAGAVAWVSGTAYATGFKAISAVDGRVYRRIAAGAGVVDPANDPTNWEDVVYGRRVRITAATVLQVRTLYELDSSAGSFNVTLPAAFSDTDWIDLVDVGMSLAVNPVTVLRNGNNIRRLAEDLVLDVVGDSLRLVGRVTLGWIEQ